MHFDWTIFFSDQSQAKQQTKSVGKDKRPKFQVHKIHKRTSKLVQSKKAKIRTSLVTEFQF
jgi:hypothetical protein